MSDPGDCNESEDCILNESVGSGEKHATKITGPKLSGYELAKLRQKEADRRMKENKKRKFDMHTKEEKEEMKRQRSEEEARCKTKMRALMESPDEVPAGMNAPITVCVDCSLDHEHQDRERRSLCKQLCYGYACVKKLTLLPEATPVRLCISGLSSRSTCGTSTSTSASTSASISTSADPGPSTGSADEKREDFLFESLTKQGVLNWNILLFRESVWDISRLHADGRSVAADSETVLYTDSSPGIDTDTNIGTAAAVAVADAEVAASEPEAINNPAPFKPTKPNPVVSVCDLPSASRFCDTSALVMLSPDATEVVSHFDPNKVYIIGGIVDRTVRSTRSLKVSEVQGITCQRLPIQEYIPTRYTHVLNVDTVLKIICLFGQYGGDWKKALEEAVPLRKQGKSANQTRDKKKDDSPDPPICDEESHP